MQQVVYVDVLLLLNLFVNYLLLRSMSAMMHASPYRIRIFISSSIGAVYSLIIFLPDFGILFSIILRVVCSAVMVLIAANPKTLKMFLRAFGCFFMSNFAFAGIMLGIWLAFKPNGMIYKNGAVYFDIDAFLLTVSAVICYIIISVISYFSKRKAPDSHIVNIKILHNGHTVEGPALFDTGNTLFEPFSSFPAIVCEYGFVEKLLNDEIKEIILNNPSKITQSNRLNEIRFISFNSVGGEGLLPAFLPTSVTVYDKGKKVEQNKVYIAVYSKKLSSGDYVALIGNPFFEAAEKGEHRYEKDTVSAEKNTVSADEKKRW